MMLSDTDKRYTVGKVLPNEESLDLNLLIYLLSQYTCYSASISKDLIVEWLQSVGPLAMT